MTSGFPKASSITKKEIEGSADLYGIWFSLASIVFLPIVFSAIALSLPNSQRVVTNIDDEQPESTVQID